jgi:hypothetical protein
MVQMAGAPEEIRIPSPIGVICTRAKFLPKPD